MIILGFMNYASHDPGACVLREKNGKIEYITVSDERISRVKYSYFFPARSIKYCMDHFNIGSLAEVDIVATDHGFHKQITNTTKHYRKLEADYIKSRLNLDFSKLEYIDSHHSAHAASAFYPSGFDDAAVLVIDGFGSKGETNSLYTADYKNGLQLIDRAYCQGIGIVYTAVTGDILSFGIGEEGKTMGLAPFGRDIEGDDILKLNPTYNGIITDFSSFIDRVPFARVKQELRICKSRSDVTSPYFAKIAYELQKETEKCVIHLANYAYEKTGKKRLCIAGGVALNCVANIKILEQLPFEQVFFQPASSDTGIPFGLALYSYYKRTGSKNRISFSVFTGKKYEANETLDVLNQFRIKFRKSSPQEVAGLIAERNIVAWFVGGSELGPRALGHRSILADPRYGETKELINAKVKHREMYRPFAPSVLLEDADDYFNLKSDSPFMLLAPDARENNADKIPAVLHVDGTGRVQTVAKEDNPDYYSLISRFKGITGIPLILNTSFNDNGEPIVETPLDALLCFMRTRIDYLYLDGLLIAKSDIRDCGELVSRMENMRRDRLKKQYEDSISLLCKDYRTEEMQAYLKNYYPMHKYYSNLHAFVALQNDIREKMDSYEHFVTDEYHLNIIKSEMQEEFFLINSRANIIIMEDIMSNAEKIPAGSFVVLYNVSLYLKDKSPVHNFYKLESVKLKSVLEAKQFGNDFSISNEFNLSTDWDRFYDTNILNYI